MTTDPNGWFLTSQALDHHATVAAVLAALPEWLSGDEKTADALAGSLARAGYALVQIEGTATSTVVHDLTQAVEANLIDPSDAPGFLARKED